MKHYKKYGKIIKPWGFWYRNNCFYKCTKDVSHKKTTIEPSQSLEVDVHQQMFYDYLESLIKYDKAASQQDVDNVTEPQTIDKNVQTPSFIS